MSPQASEPTLLARCAREAIHVPGSVQPHGFLLAVDPDTLCITHATANVDTYLGIPAAELLGRALGRVASASALHRLHEAMRNPSFATKPLQLDSPAFFAPLTETQVDLVAHQRGRKIILEGERSTPNPRIPLTDITSRMEAVLTQMERAGSATDLCELTVRAVREMTGFDRTLLYRFDEAWNGTVVAEDRNDRLPSYLDLRFPSKDIPPQARELYRISRLRLIASSDYEPVPIQALPDELVPLDLSLSTLRSVSPVHLEYMRNMGTGASMSISIMRGDRLWGLISCHNQESKHVPVTVRAALDLFGQFFSLQLAAREQADALFHRMYLQSQLTQLVAKIADERNFADAIRLYWREVADLARASGIVCVVNGEFVCRGETPSIEALRPLVERWQREGLVDIAYSNRSGEDFGLEEVEKGAGLLAISISKVRPDFVIWARPEVVQTVRWGGDPRDSATNGSELTQLHPRKSFEAWKEIVRGASAPWRKEEVETVAEFRHALIGIVLRRAEELAAVTNELKKANEELSSFSYSVSHDLRAPFRHIRSYAEILQEEKSEQLDEEARALLGRMLDASAHAGALVDNLLAFARMGRASLKFQAVDMSALARGVVEAISSTKQIPNVRWEVEALPEAHGDLALLQQVWQNLIENAVKYSRTRPHPEIKIKSERDGDTIVYSVSDNGVGFDPRYAHKLFGVFQRLHRTEDFEGTGIGLANVRRIVERHGGKTWANGTLGEGATFYFCLPVSVTPSAESDAQAHPTR